MALMLEKILDLGRKIIPRSVFAALQPIYHYKLAFIGAVVYGFPARKIKVVFVTGTKGKTSVCEMVNAVLEASGNKTALASTLRLKVGEVSEPNKFKMTIRGRFFVQRFLRRAVNAGCDWAIIEMTSEGAKQYRHKFIAPEAFIFTNLAPEHIESHGSYEKYRAAKLSIAESLKDVMIINSDDTEAGKFLALPAKRKLTYRLKDAQPYQATDHGIEFTWRGQKFHSPLVGEFNLANWLAALAFGESQNISLEKIKVAVEKLDLIKGRVERIKAISPAGEFEVVVDYAHTPDSLRAIYGAFSGRGKVCVLGNTGGGRDKWKRPLMGQIAAEHCRQIILTDEDPYDEDPKTILDEMTPPLRSGQVAWEIELDRRTAIRKAIKAAKPGEVVIITGKGTDPYIMGPNGKKTPWSDAEVVREELGSI